MKYTAKYSYTMSHIVILRFSAIGDVLMTLPVIDAVARQNPDVRFTLVSRAWAKPLAKLLPKNVGFITADLKGKHKGLGGLNRLCRRLMALHPTAIADLHDVLRTQWLRLRFGIIHIPVATVDKGRRDRRRFIKARVKTPQRSMFERYADVFRQLGLRYTSDDERTAASTGNYSPLLGRGAGGEAGVRGEASVGIAPFAAHDGKTYPLDLMEEVIKQLSARGDIHIYLFGGPGKERAVLEDWAARYPNVESIAGRMKNMAEELSLIAQLRVMVSMDSANMHLASLAGIPVVSIWGATHPFGGFLGYGQSLDDAIQVTDLDCRPCSIYGQKPCRRGDYPCLRGIKPETISQRIETHLHNQ